MPYRFVVTIVFALAGASVMSPRESFILNIKVMIIG